MSDHAEATRLLDVAIRAARLVEEPLRTAFRSGVDVAFKRDWHDVVTVHDKQSEASIYDFILGQVPDSTFVGEEGGHRGDGRVHWYVDPIDGTANFARGFAFWCVSIAAVVDDVPVAGVVLDPVAGHLFAADLDGATCNGHPIRSRARADERRSREIRRATPWSHCARGFDPSSTRAFRASTTNVAWKASSASWSCPRTRRQTPRTSGPCRRTSSPKASGSRPEPNLSRSS